MTRGNVGEAGKGGELLGRGEEQEERGVPGKEGREFRGWGGNRKGREVEEERKRL